MGPRWRRDGRELFYLTLENTLMAVPMIPGPVLKPGVPSPLFNAGPVLRVQGGGTVWDPAYDVSADGQRFLVIWVTVDAVADWTLNARTTESLRREPGRALGGRRRDGHVRWADNPRDTQREHGFQQSALGTELGGSHHRRLLVGHRHYRQGRRCSTPPWYVRSKR